MRNASILMSLFITFTFLSCNTPSEALRYRKVGGLLGAHSLVDKGRPPSYPRHCMESKTEGLVVAEVELSPLGKLLRLDILQAPDEHLAEEVRQTVTTWNFKGSSDWSKDLHIGAIGRLFFYFRIQESQGIVETPPLLAHRT